MTAAGRTLSDEAISGMTEAGVRKLFIRLRWPDGKPRCPRCSCPRHYSISTRALFKCTSCRHQYSVTSGTIWQSHHLPLKRIALATYYLCQAPKGMPSAMLAMIMGTSPNTALIMTNRIRETLHRHNSSLVLSGEVEIDGVFFGRYRRRQNVGRRSLPEMRMPSFEGRCALTLAQRNGPMIAIPVEGETSAAVLCAIKKHIAPGARLFTDDSAAYRFLRLWFELKQVNHSVTYSDGQACTNNAESFHARAKRAKAQHHRFSSGRDFDLYLAELAFKHSARDMDAYTLWETVIRLTLAHGQSERFTGYWQGTARRG
jgi:transposase-like protein